MDWNQKAAIIGYWRSGASLNAIAGITGVSIEEIEIIIKVYKNKWQQ